MSYTKWKTSILPIAAAGSMGAVRLIIIYSMSFFFGSEPTGTLASDIFFAQIWVNLTAIGWCSLLLARVPRQRHESAKAEHFVHLLFSGFLSFVGIGIAIHWLAEFFELRTFGVFCLIAGLSANQFLRHFFVAEVKYSAILYMELANVSLSLLAIVYFEYIYASIAVGSIFALTSLVFGIFSLRRPLFIQPYKFDLKGVQFGVSNLMTSFLWLSFIPIVSRFQGEELAGLLSLYYALISVSQLFARSISLRQIPLLAQALTSGGISRDSRDEMQRKIIVMSVVSSVLLVAFFVPFAYFFDSFERGNLFYITVFNLLIYNVISSFGLVDSNIALVQEQSGFLLRLNAFISTLYGGGAALLIVLAPDTIAFGISGVLIMIVVCRNIILNRFSRSLLC